jgi:hypothetical protein
MSAFKQQVGGRHYADFKIQPADFLRANKVPHLEGEIIYRVLRHAKKNGREDLEKAIHSLQLLIEMDYPTDPPSLATHAEFPAPAAEGSLP